MAMAHFTLGVVLRRQTDFKAARRAFQNTLAICTSCPSEQVLSGGEGETAAVLADAARGELHRIAVGEER
jgi:hypothetical protein